MRRLLFAVLALVLAMAVSSAPVGASEKSDQASRVTVVANGLNNPRGLQFGPDGELYVAEAGLAGTRSTTPSQCRQVPAPIGPDVGGFTARISRISRTGVRTTVADGLPSARNAVGDTLGVADVAFLDGQLYALIAGGGCSHGLAGTNNGIVKVNRDGTTSPVANLSAFWQSHPAANPIPSADDFEPDGTPYSMVAVRGSFYVVEPNSSQLDRVDRNGQVSRIIDMSALQGNTWVGPTSVAYRGNFYVGNLTPFFPLKAGAAMIFKITPSGQLQVAARGLTAVLGVVFDEDGGLYALETSGGGVLPVPRTGRVVRVRESGAIETVATGLNFPTALTFGPDGSLYVSNQGYGFGAQAGQGQIVRIELSQEKDR